MANVFKEKIVKTIIKEYNLKKEAFDELMQKIRWSKLDNSAMCIHKKVLKKITEKYKK